MPVLDPVNVVRRFNEFINQGDILGLSSMMCLNYSFTDSAGKTIEGREENIFAWTRFFALYPDYRNHFTRFLKRGEMVSVAGWSYSSFEPLQGPALWEAQIINGAVAVWRVFDDSKENRQKLGL